MSKRFDNDYNDNNDNNDYENQGLFIDTDDTEALLIRKDGDLGDVFRVDTVNSVIQFKDGNQQSGYVLTSDANGVAMWGSNNQVQLVDGTLTTPSLRFANDSDTGLYRLTNGKINIVKDGEPVLTLDNNEAQLNNKLTLKQLEIADVSFTPPSALGSVLYIQDFTSGNVLISDFGMGFDVDNFAGTYESSFDGRNSVIRPQPSVVSYFDLTNTADIAVISALNSFTCAYWIHSPGGSGARQHWTAIGSNDSFLQFYKASGNGVRFKVRQNGSDTLDVLIANIGGFFWQHFMVMMDNSPGGNGIEIYHNNVLAYSDSAFKFSLADIPAVSTIRCGGNTLNTSNINARFDTYVLIGNVLDSNQRTLLYTDAFLPVGTAIFTPQSRIVYDTASAKNKIELINPSAEDIMTWNATELEIVKGLKYTGTTPTAGYILTSDASGNATWSAPAGLTFSEVTITTADSPYQMLNTTYNLIADTSSGDITVYLPDPTLAVNINKTLSVEKTTSNILTIKGFNNAGDIRSTTGIGFIIDSNNNRMRPFLCNGKYWVNLGTYNI